LFRDFQWFRKHSDALEAELIRSKEVFIEHYFRTYLKPPMPPSWMSLEVSSLGLLSRIFSNLKNGEQKRIVVRYFGLHDVSILENWMHCFSDLRNICAHHGRLWNRRLTTHIKLPYNTHDPFIQRDGILPYKLYPGLCCIEYTLRRINRGEVFKDQLLNLIRSCPLAQEREMGFPTGWESEPFLTN